MRYSLRVEQMLEKLTFRSCNFTIVRVLKTHNHTHSPWLIQNRNNDMTLKHYYSRRRCSDTTARMSFLGTGFQSFCSIYETLRKEPVNYYHFAGSIDVHFCLNRANLPESYIGVWLYRRQYLSRDITKPTK